MEDDEDFSTGLYKSQVALLAFGVILIILKIMGVSPLSWSWTLAPLIGFAVMWACIMAMLVYVLYILEVDDEEEVLE